MKTSVKDWLKRALLHLSVKHGGVDTLYLPLLPEPLIQTWLAALVLFTHPHAVSIVVILGVRTALSWVSAVRECVLSC